MGPRLAGRPLRRCAAAAAVGFYAQAALAAGLSVQGAWVPPSSQAGVDTGLYMTIHNEADDADALMRASCPFANFSERRTVDVGEGGLADRSIPNIPVAAHATLELGPKTFHVGLIQTRDPLTVGQKFHLQPDVPPGGTDGGAGHDFGVAALKGGAAGPRQDKQTAVVVRE